MPLTYPSRARVGRHGLFLKPWYEFTAKLTVHQNMGYLCYPIVYLLIILLILFSARPRSAEYTIGICFETAKNTKAFECFFTGFQHSLWRFSTTGNLYSLKSWLWLAAVVCIVRWPISNALLNDIWLTCFTRLCNWNYWHKHRVLWPASSNG